MRRDIEQMVISITQAITAAIGRAWPFSIYSLLGDDDINVETEISLNTSTSRVQKITVSLDIKNRFFPNGNTLFSFDLDQNLQITRHQNQSDLDTGFAFLRHIIAMKRFVNQIICPYLMMVFCAAIMQESHASNKQLSFNGRR